MDFRRARVSLRSMTARTPEETHAALEAAFNAGDADAAAAAFDEHAAMFDPRQRRVVHGRDAIRAAIAPLLADAPTAEIAVLGKVQSDGLAVTHARWRVGELSGHGTIVSRRQADGRWLIVLDTRSRAWTPAREPKGSDPLGEQFDSPRETRRIPKGSDPLGWP